ncbi:MAG: restriction endonuclease subunit S, partial [Desulfuromonadales bacterium]|nr:restriction endonuclease subunit S [Desulfuromonadales bacterium]
ESPLGWIPKEWEVEKLGEILRRCGGYLQTGPFGSQLHAHEYQVEGIPVVMPQDINDGLIGTEQIARIHEVRAEQLSRHRMRIGDIVIARRGDLSRAAAISESEQGWVCGTGCFLLRLGQSALTADFAAQIYRQDFVQRQIAGRAVGTTMPSLNNSVMAGLFFPFCDEDEQARIVERLKGVEQNIRVLNECLLVSCQTKHGLMHDLLTGHVRVPGLAVNG